MHLLKSYTYIEGTNLYIWSRSHPYTLMDIMSIHSSNIYKKSIVQPSTKRQYLMSWATSVIHHRHLTLLPEDSCVELDVDTLYFLYFGIALYSFTSLQSRFC